MDKITIERETLRQLFNEMETVEYEFDPPKRVLVMMDKLRAALAAQPAEPTMDTVLRNAARRSATVIHPGRPAALPAPAAVPPGMALVPIEPTPGIITTGTVALMKASDSDLDATREEIAATYRAMIAAAEDKPVPPDSPAAVEYIAERLAFDSGVRWRDLSNSVRNAWRDIARKKRLDRIAAGDKP